MTILALDATSQHGSLALRSCGKLVAERGIESPDGFAHVLFPAIRAFLDETGMALEAIDCFAAAGGPGSFTGVRVGLAAAKGLAHALGKPAVGVSNLKALSSFAKNALRAVVLDARRGEVYAAVYDSALQLVGEETVLPFARWLETLSEPEYEFISTPGNPFWLALEGTRFAEMPFTEAPVCLAGAVALCAEQSAPSDPAELDANYVRRSDAELFWKEPGKSSIKSSIQ